MGLRFHAKAPVVIPSDDPGVVVENAEKPVDLLLDVECRAHDMGLEQRVDLLGPACLVVLVIDESSENLVRAVLRPGLRQALQFCVRRCVGGKAKSPPSRSDLRAPVVRLDRMHLVEVKREQSGLANLL